MFTKEETQFLIELMREKAASHSLAHSILGKLLTIGDYFVTLYCAGCEEWENVVEFSHNHSCRRCGRRICDESYENYGDLCDRCDRIVHDPDEEFYEAADVLRDWAMDR
jgi:hypothetical protein